MTGGGAVLDRIVGDEGDYRQDRCVAVWVDLADLPEVPLDVERAPPETLLNAGGVAGVELASSALGGEPSEAAGGVGAHDDERLIVLARGASGYGRRRRRVARRDRRSDDQDGERASHGRPYHGADPGRSPSECSRLHGSPKMPPEIRKPPPPSSHEQGPPRRSNAPSPPSNRPYANAKASRPLAKAPSPTSTSTFGSARTAPVAPRHLSLLELSSVHRRVSFRPFGLLKTNLEQWGQWCPRPEAVGASLLAATGNFHSGDVHWRFT